MENNTLNEILGQPNAWATVVKDIKGKKDEVKSFITQNGTRQVVFSGCGTSYYLAQSSESVYKKIAKMDSKAVPASEIFIFPELVFPEDNSIAVLISRSGTTTETVIAAEFIKKELKKPTFAISCYEDERLAGVCDTALIAKDGKEKSVVMTKSFTSMLLINQYLSSFVGGDDKFEKELDTIPDSGVKVLEKYKDLPERILKENELNKFIYLGQGPFFGLAQESMLKIKEMSVSHSEAYHSMEFRHGPKSLIDENTLVTLFQSDSGVEYEPALLKEMKELGAKTLLICEKVTDDIKGSADYIVELNSGISEYARLVLCMPVTQILGYHHALNKGMNPDSPKNLTQVVKL